MKTYNKVLVKKLPDMNVELHYESEEEEVATLNKQH